MRLIRTRCLKCDELREIEVFSHEEGMFRHWDFCTRRLSGATCRGELGPWPQFEENENTTAAQVAAARLGLAPVGLRIVGTLRRRIRKRVYEVRRVTAGVIIGIDEHHRVIVRWDKEGTVHIPGKDFWVGMIPEVLTSAEAGFAAREIRLRNEIDTIVDLIADGGARDVPAVVCKLQELERQLDTVRTQPG